MKTTSSLLAASLAAAALAASGSAADQYVPFVTDFPRPSQSEPYIPFVTDFPSFAPDAPPARVTAHADGFDWRDAVLGATAGFVLGALAPASLLALRRKTSVSTA